jgi:hypothetical protein
MQVYFEIFYYRTIQNVNYKKKSVVVFQQI